MTGDDTAMGKGDIDTGTETAQKVCTAQRASYLLIAVIILLVPTARTLEALLRTLLTATPLWALVIVLLLVFGAVTTYLKYLLWKLHSWSQVSRHLARALPLLCLSMYLVRLPVEFGHIVLYGALGCASHIALPDVPTARILLRVALVGLCDELLQGAWPRRVFDLHDLLLNIFAASTGVVAAPPKQR